MIQPIHWNTLLREPTPFERNGRTPRLTIHAPEWPIGDADSPISLRLLRELALLPELEVLDTDPLAPRHLRIRLEPNQHGFSASEIVRTLDGTVLSSSGFHSRDWIDEAIHWLGIGSRSDPDIAALGHHISLVHAHRGAQRDIFATTHPLLLGKATRDRDLNIHSIDEALKILSLWLSRQGSVPVNVWPRSNGDVWRRTYGRDLFYWILCRERLPAMWRYFSHCLERGRVTSDRTEYLGNTILDRCVRVLQARDEIGAFFYQPQNNTTRDGMLYHFDYLTILLSGAFDALMRVASRCYGVAIKPRQINIKNQDFISRLRANGAVELSRLLTEPGFVAFQRVLRVLRNTIHSIALRGLGISKGGTPQASLVSVYEGDHELWEASGEWGDRSALGVTTAVGVVLEPYTCATALASEGLRLVNAVALRTEVERLLLAGGTISEERCQPPDDGHWKAEIRLRIGAMG